MALAWLVSNRICQDQFYKAGIEVAETDGMTALALLGDTKGCSLEDYDLKSFCDLLNLPANYVEQHVSVRMSF